MRPIASIAFLFLLLLSSEPGGQLFKLPLLVDHYQQHRVEKRSDSFMGFLEEHYLVHHHDADSPADEDLPFKSIIGNNGAMVYLPSHAVEINRPEKDSQQGYNTSSFFIPQQHLACIFHPPRQA